MGALISYENLADSATLTNSSGGTEVLAASRVQTRQLGKVFRQTVSGAQDVILDFDLGSAKSISYVGIFGHNISAGTYDVDLGTTSGASDVASSNGTLWQGVADDPKQQHVIFSQTYSAQYVRVTLSPSAGQDVDVGRIWIDDPWTPNVSVEFEHTVEDNSSVQQSIGQSRYSFERLRYRVNRLRFPNLTEEEALGDSSDNTVRCAHAMDMVAGINAPIVCIPETTGGDAEQVRHKLGIYGSIRDSAALKVIASKDTTGGWRWQKSFTVEEER